MSEETTPLDVSSVKLLCTICGAEVPPQRAKSRSRATCSPQCHAVLRKVIKMQLAMRKCPNCYHPSSPEERADFMKWRKERGYRRSTLGRPKKQEKTIDTDNVEQSTLPPSGQPA